MSRRERRKRREKKGKKESAIYAGTAASTYKDRATGEEGERGRA
jgi:hypothetical protein